jgi:hypothetical protein
LAHRFQAPDDLHSVRSIEARPRSEGRAERAEDRGHEPEHAAIITETGALVAGEAALGIR